MAYAIDLFCGAGGMSEGIIQAGFDILFSSDIHEDAKKTYMNRHEQLGYKQGINTYFHLGDIRSLNGDFIWDKIKNLEVFNSGKKYPQQIDAIFGGPPCQGFSRAGKRDPHDPRNLLFKEYLRLVKEINPRYVVMENVQGFNDTKFYDFTGISGTVYENESLAPEILRSEFSLIGYNTLEPKVLDASDYGTPQRRKRAIFIAYRNGEIPPKYPRPLYDDSNRITVLDAIADLISDEQLKKHTNLNHSNYQLESIKGRTPNIYGQTISSNNIIYNNDLSKHMPYIIERFSLFREGDDGSAVKKRIISEGLDIINKPALLDLCSKQLNLSKDIIIESLKVGNVTDTILEVLLTKKLIRTRLDKNKPSLTVVTLPDDYISPFENRTFSVREMSRLQSFDDSFVFLGKRTTGGKRRKVELPQYTQVGNAVPPLLAKAVALEVFKVL